MMRQGVFNPESVKKEISDLARLSCSPVVAGQVMRYLESPRTTLSTLIKWISSDQILTARVLKLANSDYYGYSGQITTLNLAVITVGFEALRELLLSISVMDQFRPENVIFRLQAHQLITHSRQAGLGARLLSRMVGYPVPGEAFVAGLLHDIGYQVFLQHFPDKLFSVFETARIHKVSIYEAEKEFLGIDHSQLGTWLAQSWNFPEKLVSVIADHHSPDQSQSYHELIRLIHLSDLIAQSMDTESLNIHKPLNGETEKMVLSKMGSYFSITGNDLNYYQAMITREGKRIYNDITSPVSANMKDLQ